MSRTRIVGYVRVSTIGQSESGLSIEAQIARVRAYALATDADLVDVVIDAGVSAKTLDRDGLRNVLAMLDDGRADGVLVSKLDRLTRSVRDLGYLVDRYFAQRYALLSVADSIDTRTAAGRLVLNMLGSVGQWEREVIGERTTEALAVKRARGERTSRHAPYGKRIACDGVSLEEDETEAAVLATVRELRASRYSHRAIAAELHARGVVSPRTGKPYGKTQVGRLIEVVA